MFMEIIPSPNSGEANYKDAIESTPFFSSCPDIVVLFRPRQVDGVRPLSPHLDVLAEGDVVLIDAFGVPWQMRCETRPGRLKSLW